MLKSLRIRHFKGWKDTGDIRMAPITLFFGTNSSGKSSIGQFLMMLKQTADSSDRRAVFYPGDDKSAVQLGSYQEMVFGRDQKNKMSFEYQWNCKDPMAIIGDDSEVEYIGDLIGFYAETCLSTNNKNEGLLIVENLKYKLFDDFQRFVLSVGMDRQPYADSEYTEYTVNSEKYNLVRKQGRAWPVGSPVRFYGFPNEVDNYYQNAEFVNDLNLQHENLFKSLFYLGPLRSKTARLYSWNGIRPESVGYSGEYTIPALLSAQNRKIGLKTPGMKKSSRKRPFAEVIAESLQRMGLIENFKVNRLSAQRHEYEVKVQIKGFNAWVDLPDVGFGISQVLPVLVECFYAPNDSIIIMEQPEIHLHPSAQSALADILIDVIQSVENSERNVQLIIETHSEHFLRRLQRRIAENIIPRESISAYFVDVVDFSSKLTPLEIDNYGNIRNWPKNFFGDEMGDITAQALAALEKREKELPKEKTNSDE